MNASQMNSSLAELRFRPAAPADQETISLLLKQAREFLKDSGVDQWQGDYPNPDTIREDIKSGNAWVLTAGGEIAAYFYITYQMEEYQRHICGAWKSDFPCASVHRLMVDNRFKGQGLAPLCLAHAETLCRERGLRSIKTDTDQDNFPMQRALAKAGFSYCGTVTFDNSSKVAFEKVFP